MMLPEELQEFASYPRGSSVDKDRLKMLADGFFGIRNAFLIMFAAQLAVILFVVSIPRWLTLPDPIWILIPVTIIAAYLPTRQPVRQIGEGLGWKPQTHKWVAILVGATAPFCSGMISFGIIQHFASDTLKMRGVRIGVFSSRRGVMVQIDEL